MKKADLPYIAAIKSRGREYVYFRKGATRIRLPDRDHPDFLVKYNEAAGGRKSVPVSRNFNKLIAEYRASHKWAKLAPRTKRGYHKALEYISDNVGENDPNKMIRRDVIDAMNANIHRKKFANDLKQMFSIILEHGIDIGWLDKNPAKGVAKFKMGPGHQPWPDAALEAYAKACEPMDRLVMELGIGTGQRIGDILEMRWSHIEGDGINVKQNKTGVELYIPFTARLRSYLAQTPKKGFTIVTTIHGTEMSYNAVEQRFRTVRERAGIGNYVMHGWRYTAAQQLLLAGCSDAEIGAITGHKSLEMIAKYSRKGQQAQLARTAQEKRK